MLPTERIYNELRRQLNPREQQFVAHYLVSGNATKAARQAGYSASSPHVTQQLGYEALLKPEVAAAVQAGLDAIAARCEVSAEKVVRELAAVAFASAHHFEETKDGELCVAEGANAEAGLSLVVKHRRTKKADGSVETETIYLQQDKIRALELLGKKLKLWVDEIEVEDAQDQFYRHLMDQLKAKTS
jgi:phage terminase small subunit